MPRQIRRPRHDKLVILRDFTRNILHRRCNHTSLVVCRWSPAVAPLPFVAVVGGGGRLSAILRSNAAAVRDFSFKRVPADYYDWPLEARRDILGAASIHHLCKSIVLVNTQAPPSVTDCRDRNYSKYYIVIVQYTARFNAETVKNFLYTLNNGKISKKKFNMRLAPEETSAKLTGYEHNGVTCIGMKTDIPVILDEAIVKLNPDFFWLGGGEIDLKLGIRTPEFIDFVKPFIINCSGS
ncbi:hypothetical protein BUALT_Bualt10G0027500 [Buddleja alternifolia]|uniref:YbaK/aminoacyl-tRNA synthetase-associated domain-containing protein n=1 Tax=Buddleja alternifolia TaxID=168488 RepID=A0AAV6X271_9LAMI|nr:hypothetical protein BUALT_Bualt10G0027500 [Buddleja alternifolia]